MAPELNPFFWPFNLPIEDQKMSRFVAVDRDTACLLPLSVDEWLSSDYLARFVVEVIDKLLT